jgi:glyoxylase-like metal-dependent hydrolase (beta-lactamase superfamily II)
MNGIFTVTHGDQVTIHTYVAPEIGWMTASHLVELPNLVVLVDAPLTYALTKEVLHYASRLGKSISRVYVTQAHPDHFVGTSLVDAPTHALPAVRDAINSSGDLRIKRAYHLTEGHDGDDGFGKARARAIDRTVSPGIEVIDGVRFSFEPVGETESSEQLTIGLPDSSILLAGDVIYHGVHPFIGESHFDSWQRAIGVLERRPYTTILPGHGRPGDRGLFDEVRGYLSTARDAFVSATGPDDLNRRLVAAYPDYGGTTMQPLQNFLLFPDAWNQGGPPTR